MEQEDKNKENSKTPDVSLISVNENESKEAFIKRAIENFRKKGLLKDNEEDDNTDEPQ